MEKPKWAKRWSAVQNEHGEWIVPCISKVSAVITIRAMRLETIEPLEIRCVDDTFIVAAAK